VPNDTTKLFAFPGQISIGGSVIGYTEDGAEIEFEKLSTLAYRAENPAIPFKEYFIGAIPKVTTVLMQIETATINAYLGADLAASGAANFPQPSSSAFLPGKQVTHSSFSLTPLYGTNGITINYSACRSRADYKNIEIKNSRFSTLPVVFEPIGDWNSKNWDFNIVGTGGSATNDRETIFESIKSYIQSNYTTSCYIVPESPENFHYALPFPQIFIIDSNFHHTTEEPQIVRFQVDLEIIHYRPLNIYGETTHQVLNDLLDTLTTKFKSMRENITFTGNGKVIDSIPPKRIYPNDSALQKAVLKLEIVSHVKNS